MNENPFSIIKQKIKESLDSQYVSVVRWHEKETEPTPPEPKDSDLSILKYLIIKQHLTNYQLWHEEATKSAVSFSALAFTTSIEAS